MQAVLNKQVQIFLLAAIGLVALPHIEHLPPSLSVFFNLLLAWRFIAVWKEWWLPGKPLLFILTLTGVALLYVQHQGILGRDAGTNLFIVALGLKLLEIRTQRDVYLCVFLAFIVAATQFLYLQNIFMAAYILAVSGVLVATLICINSPHPQTWAALKLAATMVLQALPLAVAIFVFFPRVEAPRWMMFQDKHKARLGLNDILEPGSIAELALSGELAFRVKFQGAVPPPEQRYWRGPVFTQTNGKRWTENKDSGLPRDFDTPQFQGAPYSYTLLMEPQDKKWVFALDMPAVFPESLKRNVFYQLLTSKDPETRAEYKIVSYPSYNTGRLSDTERRDNLQLPDIPAPRIRELVKQLHGFDGDPETFIGNLLKYFREQQFYYTLMPPLMEDRPIERFLFETRRGFCGHYATAFAYLMRIAGIPARVIGGYQGGELNKIGNFLEIRQANAHAWTEVWLDKRGWVRVDPTAAIAPERIRQDVNVALQIAQGEVNFTPITASGATLNWLKQAAYLWDSIDYNWQRWVINYNSDNRTKLLALFETGNLKVMLYWLSGALVLLAALLSPLLLLGKTRQTDRAARIYSRFCRKLSKKGLQRKAQEGARDFAARAAKALPEQAEAIENITALYIAVRYGRNPGPEQLQALSRRVRTFRT